MSFCRVGRGELSLADFDADELGEGGAFGFDHVADFAFEGVGVDVFLVEEDFFGEEGVEFSFGDFFGDLLGLAGGFGLFDGDFAFLGDDVGGDGFAVEAEGFGGDDMHADGFGDFVGSAG